MDKPGTQPVELWGGPFDGQIDTVSRSVHELRVALPPPDFGPEGPPTETRLVVARYQRTNRRSWRFRYAGME